MTVSCPENRLVSGSAVYSTILIAVWTLFPVFPAKASESEIPMLLGSVTRAEVERVMPDWVSEGIAAEPDLAAADRLPQAVVGAEVVIYLGAWCDDSRRELARLWRALDSVGMDEPSQLTYVAVNRGMTEPADDLAGVDLIRVPTVVVRRGGVELGRIVEESPQGIEIDLLALLTGEASGSITASEDLLSEEVRSEP